MKTIYGLREAGGPIRYIGQTKLRLEERRRLWISNSRAETRTAPVYQWIRQLTSSGKVLEAVSLELAERFDEAESEWIARTPNLLNIASGGQGRPGVIQSDETRSKKAAAVKASWDREGRKRRWNPTPESIAKQSAARKAWWKRKRARS